MDEIAMRDVFGDYLIDDNPKWSNGRYDFIHFNPNKPPREEQKRILEYLKKDNNV